MTAGDASSDKSAAKNNLTLFTAAKIQKKSYMTKKSEERSPQAEHFFVILHM
jgi:hypothetical protein